MHFSFSAYLATLLLIGSLVASALFQIDPNQSYFGLDDIKFIKYLPLELGWASAVIFLFFCHRPSPKAIWLISAFGILVLFGGIITVAFQNTSLMDSFIGRGMAILLAYPAFQVVKNHKTRMFFKYTKLPIFSASLIISTGILIWFLGFQFVDQPHVYHTQVILPISTAACLFFYIRFKFRILHVFLFVFFFFSGILLLKNTGFLASLMCGLLIFYSINYRKDQDLNFLITFRGISSWIFLFFCFSLYLILSVFPIYEIYSYLPSGSPAVRIATYLTRIQMFLDSPFFGTFFTGSPILVLPTRSGQIAIPSHSDILDILAFGGLAGIFLFTTPILLTLKNLKSLFRNNLKEFGAAFIFCFSYVCLSLLNFLFNATWIRPETSSLFFISIGLLIGLDKDWDNLTWDLFAPSPRNAQ